MAEVEIYLVPGFMGFEQIGELPYWVDVVPLLERKLAEYGLHARVIPTTSLPTGSVAKRARQLGEELVAHHEPETCSSVHFLGHSTGGLDIRLLLSPGSLFDVGGEVQSLVAGSKKTPEEAARANEVYAHAITSARSAMSLATPHYGTPAAELILGVGFDKVLKALMTLQSPLGRQLVRSGIQLSSALALTLTAIRCCPKFLAWMNDAVLSRPPDNVLAYLRALGDDLGALRNLSLEAASLFNASVVRRPTVDYVSFCTATDSPKGPIVDEDPFVIVNTLIFRKMWPQIGAGNPGYPYAAQEAVTAMKRVYADDVAAGYDVGVVSLGEASNDGLVPTSSQIYGRVGAVVASDHLDAIGMYRNGERSGWIESGAAFTPGRFELLWGRVAETVRDAHRGQAANSAIGSPDSKGPVGQLANSMRKS